MHVAKLVDAKDEARNVKTLILECPKIAVKARPGNFIMVWLPSAEEVPMSLSVIKPPRLIGFTVKGVGETTNQLLKLPLNSFIGVRGPYGRGFTVSKLKAVLVGGGVGIAPLAPLAEELKSLGSHVEVIIAATTAKELIFKERLARIADKLLVATDDGTEGFKGLAHEALDEALSKSKADKVYVCGPEPMIVKCMEVALKHGVDLEASLERYIKCGVGLCGSCSINGLRVCLEGPVFKLSELVKIKELGSYVRDASGRKVPVTST
ncbi:MAG: dihydroorotate dehydrogenase electron transfer subunit [Thermoprotei archaeon]|nr:MAG: dihydroorotate dehydrogenase electron transfer subunit [Thermoprotei archaeon]